TGAEVEVDTETGHVRILRLVSVADCGTPINPEIAHGQLSGGAIMALGATLFECMQLDGGQVLNASLADYGLPGMHDVPPMHNELVAATQENGPCGGKGLGQSGSFAASPSVANGLHAAGGAPPMRLRRT